MSITVSITEIKLGILGYCNFLKTSYLWLYWTLLARNAMERCDVKLLLVTSLKPGLCSVNIGTLYALIASVGLCCVVFPSSPPFSNGRWTAAVKILKILTENPWALHGQLFKHFLNWFDPLLIYSIARNLKNANCSVEFIAWLTVLFGFVLFL